jgi:dihydroorotate dehydrogenase
VLYRHLRRALFPLPPEQAHALSLSALRFAHAMGYRIRRIESPLSLMGLQFPNRVGLAAGFDKNGRYMDALGALGFGFIEIGTVTPRAQPGQPRPRLFRLEPLGALINRMGFPNEGASVVAQRLMRRSFAGVCGVNIGKNRDTPLDRAVDD